MMMNSDSVSIQAVHSRAPALSKSDFDFIQQQMQSGRLFPGVTNHLARSKITQNLLATAEIIPSFCTLFSDIRYLKEPAKLLNALLPPKPKRRIKRSKETRATIGTLRKRYRFHFTMQSDHSIELQQTVVTYTSIPTDSWDAFDISYQQLWLCSYRVWKYPNAYGIRQLAMLAYRLGFSSAEIEQEVNKDPGKIIMEQALQDILRIFRPNEEIVFDANGVRPLVTSFNNYLEQFLGAPVERVSPYITVAGPGEPVSRRCGSSCMDTKDLNHLFFPTIHRPLREYNKGGNEISSFYIKRSRHLAFFGLNSPTDIPTDPSSHLSSVDLSTQQLMNTTTITEAEPPSLDSPFGAQAWHTEEDFTNQAGRLDTLSTERCVTFKENTYIQEVPYEKEIVNNQARQYADQGKKLHVPDGPHFIWQDCFDILTRTRNSVVLVSTTIQPVHGKRRRGQDLPDRLQPRTREDFDFAIQEIEEVL